MSVSDIEIEDEDMMEKCTLDRERSWSFDLVKTKHIKYRFLTKLISKYFSIPATSTEAERVFSAKATY